MKGLQDSVQPGLAPYPAVRLLFTVVTGILAGVYLSLPLGSWLILCAFSFAALLAGLLYDRIRCSGSFPRPLTVFGYSLFVLFSFSAYSARMLHYAPRDGLLRFSGKTVLLYGRVGDRPYRSEKGISFIMDVEEVFDDGRTVKLHDRAKVFVRGTGDERFALRYGDMVRVKGSLNLIPEAANKGEFSPRKAGRMKQVSVQLYAAGPWQVQHEGEAKLNMFERFIVQPVYDSMMKSVQELMPDSEERKLAAGVLTGQKEYLPEEVFEAFKITGTAHILAVSGLNVGLLVLAIHICLQRLKVTTAGRWVAFIIVVLILIVYSHVTGNSPSVKRAAVMTGVLIGGETLGRKTYSVNSLALSDVLILFFDPLDLLNPGFLMTNSAVLAILVIYPGINSRHRKKGGLLRATGRFIFGSFMVTLAAIIGVSPVIAFYFGTFSFISLVANIPVVLFSTLLMYALVPMLLLNLVSGCAASFFAESSFFLAGLTLRSALFFSRLPFASISMKPDAVEVLLYYALVSAILFFGFRKTWGKVTVSILLVTNMLLWYSLFFYPRHAPPDMVTVNLGRNLVTLFSPGRETVMIDAGRELRDYGRISRQLAEYGLASPEAVVQFYSPDSIVALVPARRHMLKADSLLSLSSAVIVRPEEKVLKLWSRKGSLLLVSGTGRLKKEELYKADIVFLWVYRFAENQQQQIESWLNFARPKRCILVPGSFLSRTHLAALHRYASGRPGLEIRSKTRQVVIR